MTGATRCLVAANLLLIMSQFTHLTITAVRSYFCGELPFDNLYFVYRWRFLMNPTASFSVRFLLTIILTEQVFRGLQNCRIN